MIRVLHIIFCDLESSSVTGSILGGKFINWASSSRGAVFLRPSNQYNLRNCTRAVFGIFQIHVYNSHDFAKDNDFHV